VAPGITLTAADACGAALAAEGGAEVPSAALAAAPDLEANHARTAIAVALVLCPVHEATQVHALLVANDRLAAEAIDVGGGMGVPADRVIG
jgi:hypothetical protein